MTTPQQATAVTALTNAIGRYFTVVSVIPSLLPVAVTVVLVRSGAWTGSPDFGAGIAGLTDLSVGGAIGLIMAALLLGAVLHPVQLGVVRLLEGYWGTGPFWSRLRERRIAYHVDRRLRLQEIINKAEHSNPDPGAAAAAARLTAITAGISKSIYPADVDDTMPTRLGNALRAAETRVGAPVGLEIVKLAPHLLQVAPREQAEYVDEQRTTLDLVVRICLVCMLTTAVMIAFLWPHGIALLTALIPYGLAWMAYRGTVAAAQEYGAALQVLFDLNRFTLYESMHHRLPETTAAEKELVADITALTVDADEGMNVRYRHPTQ